MEIGKHSPWLLDLLQPRELSDRDLVELEGFLRVIVVQHEDEMLKPLAKTSMITCIRSFVDPFDVEDCDVSEAGPFPSHSAASASASVHHSLAVQLNCRKMSSASTNSSFRNT